jgi:hypothetical protein
LWTIRVDATLERVTLDAALRYYATPAAMSDVGHHLEAVRRMQPALDAVVATVQGLLIYDVAALNKVEMLPWDVWGLGWRRDAPPPDDLTPFDEIAQLTVVPDTTLDALRERYRDDARFTMPGTVFNVLRNREERVDVV